VSGVRVADGSPEIMPARLYQVYSPAGIIHCFLIKKRTKNAQEKLNLQDRIKFLCCFRFCAIK
jgi:hypothetical protein